MRNYMYLRPGNLYKEFIVEVSHSTVNANGRPVVTYLKDTGIVLKGMLARASAQEIRKFDNLEHPIDHTIVQQGRPKVKPEDKLILGNRVFLVRAVDEPGSIGICTIYYVEERMDVK